jgi:hypothetical protein
MEEEEWLICQSLKSPLPAPLSSNAWLVFKCSGLDAGSYSGKISRHGLKELEEGSDSHW